MSKSIYAGLALIALSGASAANADSFNNMSQAVGDSAEASSRVIAAGGQVTLGAMRCHYPPLAQFQRRQAKPQPPSQATCGTWPMRR